MKGIVVFLVVFALLLAVTLGYPELPVGRLIYDAIGGVGVEEPILGIPVVTLVPAVFNGVIYGVIAWLVYSAASSATRGEKREQVIQQPATVQVQETEPVTSRTVKREVPDLERRVNIEKIEGIGPVYAQKLMDVGIATTRDMLEAGSTRKGRYELAVQTGISEKLILEWVNIADLSRIKGVGQEYSDLLEEAGVDTVVELSKRNPEYLFARIIEINNEKKLVRRPPTLSEVRDWVEQAKKLSPGIRY